MSIYREAKAYVIGHPADVQALRRFCAHGRCGQSPPLSSASVNRMKTVIQSHDRQTVTPQPPAQAFVITHPEMGIYLGMCMGFGFWSKLDPVGQPAACTFTSIEEARSYMAIWDGGEPSDVCFARVVPDDGTYASIAACIRAGLDGWVDEYTPVANEMSD